MKSVLKLSALTLSIALAGCSSDDDEVVVDTEGEILGPYSTGTSQESFKVYFDLDTASVVDITDEQAASNDTWDIALERYKVFLNQVNEVAIYNTNTNAEFYNEEGGKIADMFKNASAESELQDYLDITVASIPEDVENDFVPDAIEKILAGWSSYTSETGIDADNAYVVKNGENYAKFSVTAATYDFINHGAVSDITLSTSYNFAEAVEVTLDAANECNDAGRVYVDLATGAAVAADAMHDIVLTCVHDNASFSYDINLAEGLTAYPDFQGGINDAETAGFYAGYGYFKSNEYSVPAFGQVAKGDFGGTFWVEYTEAGATYWSDYNVYIVKKADKYFKLQFTSFYNEQGENGNLSFRMDELVAN